MAIHVTIFSCIQAFAVPFLPKTRETLVEVRERYNIQLDVVEETELLAGKMLPVGTKKPGYHIWVDRENLYNNQASYHFYMKDGNAERVEMSTIYTTKEDIKHLNRRELKEHTAAKSIYHFGTGMVPRGKLGSTSMDSGCLLRWMIRHKESYPNGMAFLTELQF